MTTVPLRDALPEIYVRLQTHFGAQGDWWRYETLWEIMVGAVLTQNTSWRNVERALENLKRADALAPARIRALSREKLARLIRPAGFTLSKPQRLKTLAEFLEREYDDQPEKMRGGDLQRQRAQLLELNGIGDETADVILLFVAAQPIFVIDAYTRRIMARLGYADENISYHELQNLFMAQLPPDANLFREYHALLDTHAKYLCAKRAPRCAECPLRELCARVGLD